MSGKLRIILISVGVLIVLVLVVPFFIPVNQFRPTIEEKASVALGRKVQLGNLRLSLLSGSLSAENLAVGDDPNFSSSPFLTAKSLKVGIEIMPLIFSKTINVTGVTIDSPQVTLLRNAAGRWNYSSLGGSSTPTKSSVPSNTPPMSPTPSNSPAEFSVKKIQLKDGSVVVGSTSSQRHSTYDHVNITASDVSMTSKFPVTVSADLPGGGNFKLEGTVGPIDQADALLTPLEAKLHVGSLNLASTGFLDPTLGLGGILDLDGTLASQHGEAETKGTTKLSKALLIAGGTPAGVPVTVDFNTKYNLPKNAGVKTGKDLDIESLTSNLRMAPDGLRADNFNAVVPTLGTLVGAGTIDAKNNLDFKMVATLTKSSGGATGAAPATSATGATGAAAGVLGGLLGRSPGGGSGGSTASAGQRIPFMIEGTTADPKFVPDVKGIAASMLKSQLGNLVSPSTTSQQQQNPNNPLGAIGGLFKKKKT